MEKIKQGGGNRDGDGREERNDVILYKVFRKGLSDKVIFEQSCEGSSRYLGNDYFRPRK